MKKVITFVLTIALMLSLISMVPMGVQAADVIKYNIWIGGVQVTSENCKNITGENITGKVSYTPGSFTIKLENAVINGSDDGEDAGIYVKADLHIKIVGTGEVNGINGKAGIRMDEKNGGFNEDITFDGADTDIKTNRIQSDMPIYMKNGKLTVENTVGNGIHANTSKGKLEVSGGTLSVTGKSYGVNAYGIKITGGTVIANTTSTSGFGLYSRGTGNKIEITGGTVNAYSINCTENSGTVDISGGDVMVTRNYSNGAISGYNVNISRGTVTVDNTEGNGILTSENLEITGGNVSVSAKGTGISANKTKINCSVYDAKVKAKVSGTNPAIYGTEELTIGDELYISKPENGEIAKKNSYYTVVDGSEIAKEVVIQPSKYSLWVGKTQVSRDNASDVLGDGKVKFDYESGKLTLDNVTINSDFYKSGDTEDDFTAGIYGKLENLTIEGSVSIDGAVYGICTEDCDLSLNGTGNGITALATKEGIASTGEMGSLEISGKVEGRGTSLVGIYAYNDIDIMAGSNVVAYGNLVDIYDNYYKTAGIETYEGRITINGGTVYAKGYENGIVACDGFFSKTAIGEVVINDGDITAESCAGGNNYNAAIGGANKIFINGGRINATAGTGTSGRGISAMEVSITGGVITAYGGMYGIQGVDGIAISGESVQIDAYCTGSTGTMSAITTKLTNHGTITMDPEVYLVSFPEDGVLGADGHDFYYSDETTLATHVVIEPDTATHFDINIGETTHGTVATSMSSASEGRNIKVTATPDEGYKVTKITYTPEGGEETDITEAASFKMSAANVTVSATFEEIEHRWSDWRVVKDSTETEYGQKERVCSICGNKETDVIEKKKPSGGDKKDGGKDDKKSGGGDKKDGGSKDGEKKYKNEWVNGRWYDEFGNTGYEGTLSWKSDATGWWVEDSKGWYPQSSWQKIDGIWYYFKPSGYMAANEYYKGYWFNADGSWDDQYFLSWKSDATGWWVEDISGWWPQNSWLQIDGYWYYFEGTGYMATSKYVDGWWISSDGVCY
ncbi:MAG: carbohydrate-binding domain-containing protein [Eubacterium sp.]|nr:carbohydrate-binding domain-containing protein [Eubacterium sp.]